MKTFDGHDQNTKRKHEYYESQNSLTPNKIIRFWEGGKASFAVDNVADENI